MTIYIEDFQEIVYINVPPIGISRHSELTLDTVNPHGIDATTVGLGNVDNTSDADKPISDLTQTALDLKQDSSSSFSGDYDDLTNKPTTITVQQSDDITTNNAKVGITVQQSIDITTNNAKVGITPQQATDITTNNAKVSLENDSVGNAELKPIFKTIDDLGDVSGTTDIDFDDAIKFQMNLTGNTTLTFSNLTNSEEVKNICLEITSSVDSYTLTFPTGVNLDDIADTEIDFTTTSTRNFITVRVLDATTPLFQISNYVV